MGRIGPLSESEFDECRGSPRGLTMASQRDNMLCRRAETAYWLPTRAFHPFGVGESGHATKLSSWLHTRDHTNPGDSTARGSTRAISQ
jgi:hypothetical protein